MGGRGLPLLMLAVAWVAAACSDQPSDGPTSPELKPVPPSGCSTSTLIGDIKTEFGNASAEAKLAGDLKNYGANTAQATYVGYRLLDAIAAKYDIPANQTASRTNASNAATEIFKCINHGAGTVPGSFEAQLGSTGAFAVRGFQSGDDRTVTSHDGTWVLEPPASGTWNGITTLATTGLPDSVKRLFLAHGQPGSTSGFSNDDVVNNLVFDWATVPEATFSGSGVVVGECTQTSTYLQHNTATTNPEVLGFVQPSCYEAIAMREAAPHSLAERIGRFFGPSAAFAAVATSTGTGGSKSKLSPFGLILPDVVNLFAAFTWKKSGNTVGVPLSPTPKYQIKSQAGTPFLQDFVLIWLEAVGNNGTNAGVCNNWAYTSANGAVQFPAAFATKAGGYTFIARTTGTSSKPDVEQGVAPTVPPGESLLSPIVNVKNGTLPSCPAGSVFAPGDPLPAPPGPNGFAP